MTMPGYIPRTLLIAAPLLLLLTGNSSNSQTAGSTAGELRTVAKDGETPGLCPLKHTAVNAEISGPLARVRVTQEFSNPHSRPIEAIYTFPLPQRAAVDQMTMLVGERRIIGQIKPRAEADRIYQDAKRQGHLASKLDQERPNIFTQAIANIRPGETIKIEISYVETLLYEDGTYEFMFPMTIGPRYNPASTPDAAKVTPPIAPKGTRAGHDISLNIQLDAGLPIEAIDAKTHPLATQRPSVSRALFQLRNQNEIPNKDFLLRWTIAGRQIQDAVLTHNAARGGFLSLMLAPPLRPSADDITPKELVFVLDTSGSMSGFPIEKAKESMRFAIDGLHPRDTFNLITFAGDTHVLWPEPRPATANNIAEAQAFLASRQGHGGTEMMRAIRAALAPSTSPSHLRVVCFMTDGFIGNDDEIIQAIRQTPTARIFSFGIGSSVNRFLLDKMAEAGRGEVEYVSLSDDGSKAARRFHERVRTPLLTDISIDWNGLPITDVIPSQIPDLFAAKPLVVSARFFGAASGSIRLRGRQNGREFVREIPLSLPGAEPRHDVLAPLWARRKIDQLSLLGPGQEKEIERLGLEFRLMTAHTSFVAVEQRPGTDAQGQPITIEVPVEMPEGVRHETTVGAEYASASPGVARLGGVMGGIVGGIVGPQHTAMPPPPPPQAVTTQMPVNQDARLIGPATPKPGTTAELETKLHPSLMPIAQSPNNPSPLVKGGRVTVRIHLASAEDQKLLTGLGFRLTSTRDNGKTVVGTLTPTQLIAAARLAAVYYIEPVQ